MWHELAELGSALVASTAPPWAAKLPVQIPWLLVCVAIAAASRRRWSFAPSLPGFVGVCVKAHAEMSSCCCLLTLACSAQHSTAPTPATQVGGGRQRAPRHSEGNEHKGWQAAARDEATSHPFRLSLFACDHCALLRILPACCIVLDMHRWDLLDDDCSAVRSGCA